MTPWEIVDHLHSASDPSIILEKLEPSDPFWVGASYAIDPFVGIIVRLPLRRDPPQYGTGVHPKTFEKLVKLILDGKLTGDDLVLAIEAFSHHCQENEWIFWYKRILQGEIFIPIALELFNKYCPDEYTIPPPPLRKLKSIGSMKDLPERFFVQPIYPSEHTFWLVDSSHTPIEIRGYDSNIRRIISHDIQEVLATLARNRPMDIVIFGYVGKYGLIADDLLTREQFTKESGAHPLYRRLIGLGHLELPPVQMSPLLTPNKIDAFYKEIDLILQQGFAGAIVRDLDAHYPFRAKPDIEIKPSSKVLATCTGVEGTVGINIEATRGKKIVNGFVRLGLTAATWDDISKSSPVGRRLEVLSCGQKDNELLLPVFQQWRS